MAEEQTAANPVEETPAMSEEETFWANVRKNPDDWEAWTTLIQLTERGGDKDKLRLVYDEFLKEYPLCYGYWKKYAEIDVKAENLEGAVKTYEKGVAAVPHSIDLWAQYCTYFAEKSEDLAAIRRHVLPGLEEQLLKRSVGKRGIATVGTDYKAAGLWDKYIAFETSQEEHGNVNELFRRALALPLENLDKYWARYSQLLKERPVAELMTPEEAEAFEGDETTTEDEKRNAVLNARTALYKFTKEEFTKRVRFESKITRPYFHVKPLAKEQRDNWLAYLNWETTQGDAVRTRKLFERCVVACANYAEFWMLFARFLEENLHDMDGARDVFHRATSVFVKKRPEMFVAAAEFEEVHNNHAVAREYYNRLLETVAPNTIDAITRSANFERRAGKLDAASKVYETALAAANDDTRPFLASHAARFHIEVTKKSDQARSILAEALKAQPSSKLLVLSISRMELEAGDVDRARAVLKEAVAEGSKMAAEDQLEVWDSLLSLEQDRAATVNTLREAEAKFRVVKAKLTESSGGGSKKRPHEGNDASYAKKAATAVPQAAVPAYTAQDYSAYYGPQYAQYYQQQAAGAGAAAYGAYAYPPQTYPTR